MYSHYYLFFQYLVFFLYRKNRNSQPTKNEHNDDIKEGFFFAIFFLQKLI